MSNKAAWLAWVFLGCYEIVKARILRLKLFYIPPRLDFVL